MKMGIVELWYFRYFITMEVTKMSSSHIIVIALVQSTLSYGIYNSLIIEPQLK